MLPLRVLLFYLFYEQGKHGPGKIEGFGKVQFILNLEENNFMRKAGMQLRIDDVNVIFLQLCMVDVYVCITSSPFVAKTDHEGSIHT